MHAAYLVGLPRACLAPQYRRRACAPTELSLLKVARASPRAGCEDASTQATLRVTDGRVLLIHCSFCTGRPSLRKLGERHGEICKRRQAITSGKGALPGKSRKTETERRDGVGDGIEDEGSTENGQNSLTVRFSGNERKGSRNHRVTTEWFQTSGSKMANALRRVQDSGRNFRATRHP